MDNWRSNRQVWRIDGCSIETAHRLGARYWIIDVVWELDTEPTNTSIEPPV